MTDKRRIKHQDWLDEAKERFGDDAMKWAFVCPSCGHVATVRDWRQAGAGEGEVAFSCVGRRLGATAGIWEAGPCNYAGGGLFRLNPVEVEYEDGKVFEVFEFAPAIHGSSGSIPSNNTGIRD